jgi:hypothetical protein
LSAPAASVRKKYSARIQIREYRHLQITSFNNTATRRKTQMTKLLSLTAAVLLFAPAAYTMLMQAAQIVA